MVRSAWMSWFNFALAGLLPTCVPSDGCWAGPAPGIRPDMSSSPPGLLPCGDGGFIPASIEGDADAGELTEGIESDS